METLIEKYALIDRVAEEFKAIADENFGMEIDPLITAQRIISVIAAQPEAKRPECRSCRFNYENRRTENDKPNDGGWRTWQGEKKESCCKDCRHWKKARPSRDMAYCTMGNDRANGKDYYCSEAERKEEMQ